MSDPAPSAPETNAQMSARAALSNVVATVVSGGIAVVLSVVLARALGPDEYGRYAYLTYLLALVAALTTLGVPLTVMQLATAAHGTGNSERARHTLSSGTTAAVVGAGAMAAVLVPVAGLPLPWAVALVAGILATQWLSAAAVLLVATARVSRAALVTVVTSVGSLATVYVIARRDLDAERAFALLTAQAVLFVPVTLLIVRGAWVRPLLTLGPLRPYLNRRSFENWVVGVGTLTVFARLEILALQRFDTSEHVAVYSLAFGLAARLATPVEAILAPLLPSLVNLHEREETERLRVAVRRATVAMSAIGGLFAAGALPCVLAVIPVLYGDRFTAVQLPFLALGWLVLLKCLTLPATSVLLASRRQAVLVKATLLALAVDIALAVALVPWASVSGAVVANTAAQVTSTAVVLGGVFGDQRRALLRSCRAVLVISVLASLPGAVIAAWQPNLVGAAVGPLVSLACFAAAARLSRAVVADDVRWVARALPGWLRRPVSFLVRLLLGV